MLSSAGSVVTQQNLSSPRSAIGQVCHGIACEFTPQPGTILLPSFVVKPFATLKTVNVSAGSLAAPWTAGRSGGFEYRAASGAAVCSSNATLTNSPPLASRLTE